MCRLVDDFKMYITNQSSTYLYSKTNYWHQEVLLQCHTHDIIVSGGITHDDNTFYVNIGVFVFSLYTNNPLVAFIEKENCVFYKGFKAKTVKEGFIARKDGYLKHEI